jgi:phosphoglycolate phosphatase-like HAD superfamily hydrolase
LCDHVFARYPTRCDTFVSMAQPSQLKLAVFDLDGTLVELEIEHFVEHAVETTRSLGIEVPSRERIRHLMHTHSIEQLFPPEERPRALKAYWHNYDARLIPAPRLINGALATLEEMVSRGFDLAIATARTVHADELREILRPTGIMSHVEFLSTWWQTGWTEKREQLESLCREHKVEPVQALMVGDSVDDMRSSRACGFGLRVALLNGMHHHEVLSSESPDYLIESIGQVPSLVDQHRSRERELA